MPQFRHLLSPIAPAASGRRTSRPQPGVRRRRLLQGACLSGALLIGFSSLAAEAPPAAALASWSDVVTQHDSPGACADVLFVGVRGSGQRATDHEGYGGMVQTIRDGVADALDPNLTVRQIALDYPSLPLEPTDGFDGSLKEDAESLLPFSSGATIDFNLSVIEGWYQLTLAILDSRKRCSDQPEKIVLAGYSQGALVVHRVLAEMGSFPELAAAVIIADPARKVTVSGRTDAAFLMGDPQHKNGVWSAIGLAEELYGEVAPIPPALAARTLEICNAHDLVCDPDADSILSWVEGFRLGLGGQIHTSYGQYTSEAAGINAQALNDAGAWAANRTNLEFERPALGSQILEQTSEAVPYLLGAGSYSMAARADGSVFVTSGGNRRAIFGFAPGGTGYAAISTPSNYNPAYPYAVTTDWAGNVYATHTYSPTLIKYTTAGAVGIDLTPYSQAGWSREGTPLAVDRDGNIYLGRGSGAVPDGCGRWGAAGLGNMYKLSPHGDYMREFPTGNFSAVAADARGAVYVLTTENNILKIDADGAVSPYATMPDGFNWVSADMTSDSQGNLYVIKGDTPSCTLSATVPDPASSPIWRVDASTQQVSEWAPATYGRRQIAAISDSRLALYVDRFGGNPSVERITVGTATEQPSVFTAAPAPVITGTPRIGQVLTANAGDWMPVPSSIAYQWYRNGDPIDGADVSTYTLTDTDARAELTVRVTPSLPGYETVELDSSVVAVEYQLDTTPTPQITGDATVGSVLAAEASGWGPAPVDLAYEWRRNDSPIAGATAATYLASVSDVDTSLSVAVTGSKSGYDAVTQVSSAVTVAAAPLIAAAPTISGSAVVDATLTADSGQWNPQPVALTYQWRANGITISGATGSSYRPVAADVGQTLTVAVSGSKSGYVSMTRVSAPTVSVRVGAPAPAAPVFLDESPAETGVVGEEYSYEFRATGYPEPTYSLGSGTLPPGVALNAGKLSGILTGPGGTHTFRIDASNSARQNVPGRIQTVTIDERPAFTANEPMPTATVGSAYSYTFAASGFPTPTFAVTSGTLPKGLSLSDAGVLAGSPSGFGGVSTGFTVTASNRAGADTTGTPHTIGISAAPLFTAQTPPAPPMGAEYNYAFTATGYPDVTYSVTSGSLPAGLNLATNGILSGVRTGAADGAFTVTARNTAGADALGEAHARVVWPAVVSTVTFDGNGRGAAMPPQVVTYPATSVAPTTPTAEGFIFGGWYQDSAMETEFVFDENVLTSVTAYAKWTAVPPVVVVSESSVELALNLTVGGTVEGAPLVVSGTGLLAGSNYTVTLRSTPVVLLQGIVASSGAFMRTLVLPAGIPAGRHTVTLDVVTAEGVSRSSVVYLSVSSTGTASHVSTVAAEAESGLTENVSAVPVIAASAPTRILAGTGVTTVPLGLGLGAVLVLVGSALLVRRRRHSCGEQKYQAAFEAIPDHKRPCPPPRAQPATVIGARHAPDPQVNSTETKLCLR